jgi:REP element-mobilizing transposase RayT
VKELPQRKQIRLKGYDYSRNGTYFITLCVKDRAELLGNIEFAPPTDTYAPLVGGGVPDAPMSDPDGTPSVPDAPHCKLTPYGDVVARRLADICRHDENIKIPHYVIMPNHVHMIILVFDNKGNETSNGNRGMSNEKNGTSMENGTSNEKNETSRTPSPTNAVIPAFVSTLKRFTNKDVGFSLWQRSFHDHIIRDERDYYRIAEYIKNNPQNWRGDRFYVGRDGYTSS